MNQLAKNERIKLIASGLNTIAVSLIVTGVVVPLVGLVYGNLSTFSQGRAWAIVIWIGTAIYIHTMGLLILGRLK